MKPPGKVVPAHPHHAAMTLARTYRVPAEFARADLSVVLQKADTVGFSTAPFKLADVAFVPEQLSVVPQMLRPTRGSRLLSYLTEYQDQVRLVYDGYLPGPEGLFFCRATSDRDVAMRWLQRAAKPTLLINEYQGEILIAAPVTAFAA